MPIDYQFQAAIREVVELLVRGEFAVLERDGRSGRLNSQEIESAISEYGKRLISLPDNSFQSADCYDIEGVKNTWTMDIPLWTAEEGESDLTLSITVTKENDSIHVGINDIHVL